MNREKVALVVSAPNGDSKAECSLTLKRPQQLPYHHRMRCMPHWYCCISAGKLDKICPSVNCIPSLPLPSVHEIINYILCYLSNIHRRIVDASQPVM